MIKKEDFSCPKCRHKNRVKIIETVEKDKIAKVIDKSIFKQECKKCHEIISVEYPLKVQGNEYLIYYTPGKNLALEKNTSKINRVCDTFEDLKEKILILEDDLNDIIIEVVKDEIKNNLDQLDIKNIDDLERIRYNSKNEKYLNFSLVGIGKLVGFEIIKYQNLVKKIKIKKIDKSVLIDEYTYKNYIRRGNYEITNKKRFSFFKS